MTDQTPPGGTVPEPAKPAEGSGSATARRLRQQLEAAALPPEPPPSLTATYKSVFLKGLATLLPTILTLWIVVAVYGFIDGKIASPIASLIKSQLIATQRGNEVAVALFDLSPDLAHPVPASVPNQVEAEKHRQEELAREVDRRFPSWVGFALAIVAVFVVGFFIASFIGRSLWQLLETSIMHVPLIRSVYPSAKQMVEFLLAGEESRRQSREVVAIEYPRKGLWTIGYVTGKGLPEIEKRAGQPVRAVFLPASPTSMTGYVVVAQLSEIIELDMTVDEALKFTISGGVVSPTGEKQGSQRAKTAS